MMLRSPIISVLGHVDHGKTSLLDRIRRSNVSAKEAGGITQMIGASYLSTEHILSIAGDLMKRWNFDVKIPGLLFIDTPGHEAFTLLREQGSSISDLAILVIDIKQGIQPQTIESINMLKNYKTPFVVALTKLDLISGWKRHSPYLQENITLQSTVTTKEFEDLLWKRIGELSEHNLNADLFFNIRDFTRTIALVPVSSHTGEGFPELIGLICGLSQRFLRNSLEISPNEIAEGTIIDIKKTPEGNYVDVILYKGTLRKGDQVYTIDMAGNMKSVKIRGMFLPKVSSNNPKDKYVAIDKVAAAAGIRIFTGDVEGLMIGFPISGSKEMDRTKIIDIFKEGEKGIILKTDSVGSADAFRRLAEKEGVLIRRIGVGNISKDDIELAIAMNNINPDYGFILGFNVNIDRKDLEYAESHGIQILLGDVIYRIVEAYKERVKEKREKLLIEMMKRDSFPAKLLVLGQYIFRKKDPAIFGIKLLEGELRTNFKLMNKEGEIVGEVVGIQKNKEALRSVKAPDEIAIAVSGGEIGDNILPDHHLWVYVNDINNWKDIISEELYKEYKEISLIKKIRN